MQNQLRKHAATYIAMSLDGRINTGASSLQYALIEYAKLVGLPVEYMYTEQHQVGLRSLDQWDIKSIGGGTIGTIHVDGGNLK